MKTFSTILIVLIALSFNGKAHEIHTAAANGDLEKVIFLLTNNENLLNIKDRNGMTALHHAIESGNNTISVYLIENGADLNLKDEKFEATPLHYAVAKGNLEITEIIIDKNEGTLEERDKYQKTALLIACENGQASVVKFLLDFGADIKARDQLGLTPLMSACSGWNMEVVELLVNRGVSINDITVYQNKEYTALTIAALYGFKEMVNYLIELKAYIPETVLDLTLRYAVQRDLIPLFEYVQEKGLEIGGTSLEKQKELIYLASASGSEGIFKALMRNGFDALKKDRYGWTVLHHAASRNKSEMIDFLVKEVGIEKNARSIRGETAYNVADFLNHKEAVQILQKLGADMSEIQFPEIVGLYMGQEPPGDTPEMFMPGIISGPYRAHGTVVFSPDGKEAYWSDMIPGQQAGLEMKMINNRWTPPERSIMWKDPSISPDGNTLIYISNHPLNDNDPGGKENYWYMDRTETGWTDPRPMDTIINKLNIHWHCSMDNMRNLYFSEFADNMYISEFIDGKYQEPINLKDHYNNPTFNGHCPFISPTGDYLIFADRDRLYISFKRGDSSWTDRIDLGDDINAGAGNGSPKVSHDGKYLFFQSTTGDERPWGIYWVSTHFIHDLKQEILNEN